ncbi:hypothetical protein [Acidovorax sp. Leaf76]|uniref:hypothetical protein n=1 Tax=Acidovorax sp. Leaf76 TaxID=1736236 RepID=UPI0012E25D6A|nr:hypothetical protein [Acidovorax sp. Leaf76]
MHRSDADEMQNYCSKAAKDRKKLRVVRIFHAINDFCRRFEQGMAVGFHDIAMSKTAFLRKFRLRNDKYDLNEFGFRSLPEPTVSAGAVFEEEVRGL